VSLLEPLRQESQSGDKDDLRLPCFREDVHEGLQEGALLCGCDIPLLQPFLDVGAGDLERMELVV
jgi:hypothetical protein